MSDTTCGNRSSGSRGLVARGAIVKACVCALPLVLWSSGALGQTDTETHRTFTSPEAAVEALVSAAKTGSLDELLALFGPEGRELIASSDPAAARRHREVFVVASAERRVLVDDDEGRKTLVIGYEQWPFPVPLVRDAKGWRFDTAAGKEEVIARRIGRNELEAIETCRAYVTAQQRYAAQAHDGRPAGVYATKFQSDPGTENGLYWPAATGQKRSPLGELVAEAAEEGQPLGREQPSPLHGYYFKILTAQGPAASGGAASYVVDGAMSKGFALVAWPAQYDVTGIMTFLVGRDGVVHERNLGPETAAAAQAMTTYNPDSSWRPVP